MIAVGLMLFLSPVACIYECLYWEVKKHDSKQESLHIHGLELTAITAVLHFIQNRNCSCFDLNDVWLLRKEKSYNCLVLFVLV